jgi:hypothetical protein
MAGQERPLPGLPDMVKAVQEMSDMLNAAVQTLVQDGWSDEQARVLLVHTMTGWKPKDAEEA